VITRIDHQDQPHLEQPNPGRRILHAGQDAGLIQSVGDDQRDQQDHHQRPGQPMCSKHGRQHHQGRKSHRRFVVQSLPGEHQGHQPERQRSHHQMNRPQRPALRVLPQRQRQQAHDDGVEQHRDPALTGNVQGHQGDEDRQHHPADLAYAGRVERQRLPRPIRIFRRWIPSLHVPQRDCTWRAR